MSSALAPAKDNRVLPALVRKVWATKIKELVDLGYGANCFQAWSRLTASFESLDWNLTFLLRQRFCQTLVWLVYCFHFYRILASLVRYLSVHRFYLAPSIGFHW